MYQQPSGEQPAEGQTPNADGQAQEAQTDGEAPKDETKTDEPVEGEVVN